MLYTLALKRRHLFISTSLKASMPRNKVPVNPKLSSFIPFTRSGDKSILSDRVLLMSQFTFLC